MKYQEICDELEVHVELEGIEYLDKISFEFYESEEKRWVAIEGYFFGIELNEYNPALCVSRVNKEYLANGDVRDYPAKHIKISSIKKIKASNN